MKKIFWFISIFSLFFFVLSFNPQKIHAQYGSSVIPTCYDSDGVTYKPTLCLSSYYSCNRWCIGGNAPSCPTSNPVPINNGRACATCAEGYKPNDKNTACIKSVDATTPTPTSFTNNIVPCNETADPELYCKRKHGENFYCSPSNKGQLGDDCSQRTNATPTSEAPKPSPTSIPNASKCIQVSEESHTDPCPAWHNKDKNYYCAGPGAGTNDGCTKIPAAAYSCKGQKVVNGDTVEYSCNNGNSCSGGLKKSGSALTCGDGQVCCYKDIPSSEKPTTAPQPTKPSGGSGGGGKTEPTSPPQKSSCPADGDSCFYTEGDKCYSGHGANGINKEGCKYSCGPVDNSKCKTSSKEEKKNTKRDYINCTPGDAVGTDEKACPNGKKGTCGGHYYCVWSEEGNYKSDFKCETEKDTCFDKDAKEESSKESSCKDNPTSPPDGYTWKNSCKSCGSNDDCPQNTKDNAVSADTSNWCYGGKCLMLVSGSSSSKNDKKNDEKKSSSKKKEDDKKKKEKDKKKEDDKKKKDKNDGKTKDDTGNRNKNHSKQDKSDREKAQKSVDEQNKKLAKQGKPTLTPLPPDNGAYEAYLSSTPNPTSGTSTTPTPTITPTPQPPLAEPGNWQGFCAQTTDSTRPWGIKVSWDAIGGAPRYAVRIDEDAPSWEGDTPSPGDTVDNQVTNTYYIREAKPGATYQWWVHSVNEGGVYSTLTKKMIIKCPSLTNTTATPPPQSFGAGQLIVLPAANTTPTATPTPKK